MLDLFTPHVLPGIRGNAGASPLSGHRRSGADRAISPGARQTASSQAW